MVALALAGCGTTTYFAGRALPPSGLTSRVLIAIQNPNVLTRGALQFVDSFYDIRFSFDHKVGGFPVTGFSGALPISIQNMPEEQFGAVYSAGDGKLSFIDYQKEVVSGAQSGLNGTSSSVFVTRNRKYAFAASQSSSVFTVVDQVAGKSIPLSLPGVYRVSVNPGGSVALAFVQNSDYVYYPRKLTASQTLAYSGGSSTWPRAAVDCEPQNGPLWCLFQVQSPDNVDSTGNSYGAPLVFDRPVKAVFSPDGSKAYILNCGPECGGGAASVSLLPTAPLIFLTGQQSGALPVSGTITSIPVPGGASNALVSNNIMYVTGQQRQTDGLFSGVLSVLDLTGNAVTSTTSISDGAPGGVSRMVQADDNTLWIGMTRCNNGERYALDLPYGCLTMYNTASNTVTMIEPYLGDLTGIAAVTGLHKIYVAQGGQVYIYSTKDGSSINNQYVTVTGTAYDVAYMDAHSDSDNTVY